MNVLIISPYYPPFADVSVVRMASLSRYLTDKGISVTVVKNNFCNIDSSRLKTSAPKNVMTIDVDVTNNGRFMKKFFYNRKSYLRTLKMILSHNSYDVVIITVGPFYTLSLCRLIKKKYNIKCIIDFRDLWIAGTHGGKDLITPKMLLSKLILFPIERTAIKFADLVVTVTKGWRKDLMEFYPKHKDKMEIVYNGFDDLLLKGIENKEEESNETILGVFGKLSYYSPVYSKEFFKAVKKVRNNYSNIKIMQIGIKEEVTKSIIKELSFPEVDFSSTGFCDYKDGMYLMQKSKICILVDNRKKGLGTKIYDYIYLNKPIIYIGPKGTDLADLVESFENGFVCHTSSDITKAIDYILVNKITHLYNVDKKEEFSRSKQNEKYFSLLKRVVSKPY